MKALIHALNELAVSGEAFVLATVISRNGSAPRSAGARMLVQADGRTTGTVGGGILEAQVKKLAEEGLKTHHSIVRNFQFSGEDASTMDAICGGQVDVLVEWVNSADVEWKKVLEGLTSLAAQHKKGWYLTAVPEGTSDTAIVQSSLPHAVVQNDGSFIGSFAQGQEVNKVLEVHVPELLTIAGRKWLVEPIDPGGVAYIFGGGHVGRSLAQFTRAVGFYTVVLDDRSEYANPQNIPDADETLVLDSFENALSHLAVDAESFIVIVTRGHLNDKEVLAQALKTQAGYIGMIGSRRKCAMVFDQLRKAGFGEADIQRVHAPIGLHIRAETPEEIGVSIAAEMIQVRAELSSPLKEKQF